jgi:type IV secretion system protein TrbL
MICSQPAHGTSTLCFRNIVILFVAIVLSTAAVSSAQSADPPSQMLKAYRAQRTIWFTNVLPAANALFGLLALIDFTWSAAVMVLEKQDFHTWVSALVRKMMTIGAFYALLVYGRFWIPAIVDSFEILGQNAAGTGPLDPGDVFTRGLNLAGALIDGATTAGLFTNFGASLALVFAAVMCLLGFCVITIQFVVAMVESYILVAAAFVFLGFGGSRWSSPYVERYIALAVSVGVKILVIYLLISTGMNVSLSWLTDAEQIATAAQPATSAFSIMGASVILAALCWQAPKLISGVLGGSPAFTGNDVISTVATMGCGCRTAGVRCVHSRWIVGFRRSECYVGSASARAWAGGCSCRLSRTNRYRDAQSSAGQLQQNGDKWQGQQSTFATGFSRKRFASIDGPSYTS